MVDPRPGRTSGTTGPDTTQDGGPDRSPPSPQRAASPTDEVVDLFARFGDGHYGEVVDQRSHALQCAALAHAAGGDDELVAAALLHDIGHLLAGPDPGPWVDRTTDDDRHEAEGARWIAPRFGGRVARTVALHVLAKRYRCTVDPAYHRTLSPTSRATLEAQGGLLDAASVARFEAHPGREDALALRTWDEEAKDRWRGTPGLTSFLPVLRRLEADVADGGPDPLRP